MKLTDETAIKLLKKVDAPCLEERIESYPDDEREGRSDMQMLADELSYYYSLFMDDDCIWYEDLKDARAKLRKTNNGKRIPLDPSTFKPKYGYWPSDIRDARNLVNEVARVKRLGKKLQSMDYYGDYYLF